MGSTVEDSGDLTPERPQESAERTCRPFFEAPSMDRAQLRWHSVAVLEIFRVRRTSLHRSQVRHAAQFLTMDARWCVELTRRQRSRRTLHELGPDWQCDPCAVCFPRDSRGLIESDPNAGDNCRR